MTTADERRVWTAEGLEWRWNRATSPWECLCKVCETNAAAREALSLADLEVEHGAVSDWQPRADVTRKRGISIHRPCPLGSCWPARVGP